MISQRKPGLWENPVSLWVAVAPIEPPEFFRGCFGVLRSFPWEFGMFLAHSLPPSGIVSVLFPSPL